MELYTARPIKTPVKNESYALKESQYWHKGVVWETENGQTKITASYMIIG